MSPARKVAVVGGGWAGCAAAAELARGGSRVTLYESQRTLGGRARAVELHGRILDNGQHIMLGAYRETLRIMRLVGVDADRALRRLPLQMRYPAGSGMDFVAARLPAPWHVAAALLRARGLAGADKMALARFSTTARWMGWKLNTDCSVAELLERFEQTPAIIRLMWRPLCIAALNTPPERASAQVFLNVLRDSLGARRGASDMLVPRTDLTAAFPAAAAQFVSARGGAVHTGASVSSIVRSQHGWRLESSGAAGADFDAVVLATAPRAAARLLPPDHPFVAQIGTLGYEPITTCYLQYEPAARLEQPFCALLDDEAAGQWGQFVFDRGQFDPAHGGLFAVVISASTAAAQLPQEALARALASQLAAAFGDPALEHPLWSRVVTEKRATFSCAPGLVRPPCDTGLPGLALAGDYTAADYPATIETAVRSGVQAAALIAAPQ